MDRLAQVNQNLTRLQEQLAGLENALIGAEPAGKVRLRQQIEDLQAEMRPFEAEKAKLLAVSAEERSFSETTSTPSSPTHISPAKPINMDPLNVFISYAHADEAFKNDLVIGLKTLEREGKIRAWQDRDIEAGTEWDPEIKTALEAADIVLLLVTRRFLGSDYCFDVEMKRSLERHEAGTARVIPIVLSPCEWEKSPCQKFQALPSRGKPVSKWDDRDEAWLDVEKGLRRAVESLQAKKAQG